MQPSASTPGEAPQPRQSEGKTPVPSRAQQSSARLRGARQHPPLPFVCRSARLRNCEQPARGTAHGGGSCGRLQRERDCAPKRWNEKAEWAGLEGMERKGRGREREGGGTGSGGRKGKGGWERGIPEAGEGMAGWVPQELPRGKDNAQESRTVRDSKLTGQGRRHIKGLSGGRHGRHPLQQFQIPSCSILNRLWPRQFRFKDQLA